jgi:hypothetical protein
MHEQNAAHSAPGEAYVEHATTIPPAPATPVVPMTQPVEPVAAYVPPAPTHSGAQRNTRLSRLLLRRTLRGLGAAGRALRPYALTLSVLVVSLAVIGWLSTLLMMPEGNAPSFARAESIPPAPAVESFLRGQQSYDGALMWDSFSEQLKAQLLSQGDSKPTWETRAQMEQRAGQKYMGYDYIGGVSLEGGSAMYFYLVDVESPRPDRSGPTSYVFTVDPDGKIIDIE